MKLSIYPIFPLFSVVNGQNPGVKVKIVHPQFNALEKAETATVSTQFDRITS